MALTETWLKGHTQAELNIDGYRLFRSDRKGRQYTRGRFSGGAALYMRSDISATAEQLLTFSNGVVEALVVHSERENLMIVVLYRQPDSQNGPHPSTSYELSQALNKIQSVINSVEGTPNIIMCGDFNIPTANWTDGQLSNTRNPTVSTMQSFQDENLLIQMVKEATHNAGNILDLIFTNNQQLFNEIACHKTTFSDHYIVDVSTHFKSHFSNTQRGNRKFFNTFDALNFFSDNVNWEAIQAQLQSHHWEENFNKMNDAVLKLNHLIETCEAITEAHVPKKKIMSSSKSKVPRDRKILMRRRAKVNKHLRKITSPSRLNKLNQELIEIEKQLQKSYTNSSNYQEQKAIESIKKNPKYFFTYVKKFSKVKPAIGPLLDKEGKYVVESKQMANILSSQYSSTFSEPREEPIEPSTFFESTQTTNMTDINFSPEDIINSINDIPLNSAAGPDGFPAILLHKCKDQLATPLYQIWRQCLDEGITPDQLKRSRITPIHKGDSTALPKNYRPVALTSHLVKLFEKIIRKHVVHYLDEQNLFNTSQHGFRSGRSCLSQLLAHYDKIISLLEQGQNVDVIYLDFAKAFDKLDFNVTFQKLKQLGIGGKIGKWIHSFLTNRHQTVVVNGEQSDPAPVISGVPQGSVIGPLLFLILIGDIDSNVSHSFLSSFADDTRIGKGIATQEDVDQLQADLHEVYNWADENNMSFNDNKFELLRYGKNLEIQQTTNYVSNKNEPIHMKSSTKDLGVTMSSTGEFKDHINRITDTVKDLTAWILRSFKSRSKTMMLQLWKSLVIPRLDYCSQLWNPSKQYLIQQLEELQKSFVKHIHGYSGTDYWTALQELGLYSLQRRRERYQIIYIWSIIESLVPNITNNEDGDLIKLQSTPQSRRGRMLATPVLKSHSRFSTLRFHSLPFAGARLFNALPISIRNLSSCSKMVFKSAVDKLLSKIPDQPLLRTNYLPRLSPSNNIMEMMSVSDRWSENDLVEC